MAYKIKIEPDARLDIQEAINWYNAQQKGLGKNFHSAVLSHFDNISKNPHYAVRYDHVHCLPLKKFPFMVHFTVDDAKKIVTVRAVFHTSLNPDKWINK